MCDKFIYLLYMVKKVITSKKKDSNKRKTRKNTVGGNLNDNLNGLKQYITNYKPQKFELDKVMDIFKSKEAILTTKDNYKNTFINNLSSIKDKKIFIHFDGTGCTKGMMRGNDNFLDNANIQYGLIICYEKSGVWKQILTSIGTILSQTIKKCAFFNPFKKNKFIHDMKKFIKTMLINKNKVFLYGHSYGGTIVTKLMSEIKDNNLFGRTFGSPYVINRPNIINIVYKQDEIVSQTNSCANNVIILDLLEKNDDGYKHITERNYTVKSSELGLQVGKTLNTTKIIEQGRKQRSNFVVIWSYIGFEFHREYNTLSTMIASEYDLKNDMTDFIKSPEKMLNLKSKLYEKSDKIVDTVISDLSFLH